MSGTDLFPWIVATAFLLVALLVAQLRNHRQRGRSLSSERQLTSTLEELQRAEDRLSLFCKAIDLLDEALVILDARLVPIAANPSAMNVLGIPDPRHENNASRSVPIEILKIAESAAHSRGSSTGLIELWAPDRRSLAVTAVMVGESEAIVVVGRDISSERATQSVRRRFVTNASHELKSPVASLMSLAEGISLASIEDPDAVPAMATRMVRDSQRLGDLVRDLLDLSRLEERAVSPTCIVDLSALIVEEVRALTGKAASCGVKVSTNIESTVTARGDGTQLVMLIRNLMDNAIRYMPSGGTITVSVRSVGQWAQLEVADTGIGIPLKDQKRIFERFYRVDEARTRHLGGTGLGLSIVKHVVELHGGEIELHSVLEKGSRFVVSLPGGRLGAESARRETA